MSKIELEEGMDADLAEELMEEFGDLGGNSNLTYKVPEDGDPHAIRVLPGKYGKSKKVFFRKQTQHWGPDPKGKAKFNLSYTCPQYQDKAGDHCPFCEARIVWKEKEDDFQRRVRSADTDEVRRKSEAVLEMIKKVVSALNYRQSFILDVVPRDARPSATHIFYAPKTVFEPIFRQFAQNTDLLDPHAGHDFNITRTKVNNQVKYSVDPVLKAKPLSKDEDEIDRLLAQRHDLNKEVDFESLEDMEKSCEMLILEVKTEAKKGSGGGRKKPAPKQEDDLEPPSTDAIPDDDDELDMTPSPAAKQEEDMPDVDLDEETGDEETAGGNDEPVAKEEPKPKPKPAAKEEPKAADTASDKEALDELAALEAEMEA